MSAPKISVSRPASAKPAEQSVAPDAPPQTVTPTAPAETAAPAPAPAPQAANPNTPVVAASQAPAVPSYYGGEEESDVADIRFPRLNIAQKTSGAELVKLGLGSFILNKDTALGNKIRVVVWTTVHMCH